MDLKFSHVDVLVTDLEEACAYYAHILNARISKTLIWERGGLHVRYAIALVGQERFMLVQPLAGRQALSHGSVSNPAVTFFKTLLRIVISSTTASRPLELVRGVSMKE